MLTTGAYSNDKSYVIPNVPGSLAALLNSMALWWQLTAIAPAVRGGYHEARVQYVGALKLPDLGNEEDALDQLTHTASTAAADLHALSEATLHRLADLAPDLSATAAFRAWPDLSFAELRALIAKRFRATIPVEERDGWERWFTARRAEATTLRATIADADAEINDRVFALFGLDADEQHAILDTMPTS